MQEDEDPAWLARFKDYVGRDPRLEQAAIDHAFDVVHGVLKAVAEALQRGGRVQRLPVRGQDFERLQISYGSSGSETTLTATREGHEAISFMLNGVQRKETVRYNFDTGRIGLFMPGDEPLVYPSERTSLAREAQDELEERLDVETYVGSLAVEWARASRLRRRG